MPPPQRVSFLFSLDDLVDVSLRSWASPASRRTTRRFALRGALKLGIGIYAGTMLVEFVVVGAEIGPSALLAPPAIAVVAALATYGFTMWSTHPSRRAVREMLEAHAVDAMAGIPEPWDCAVAIGEDGLIVEQCGTTMATPWANIDAVRETSTELEIFHDGDNLLVIRGRAFRSPSHRRGFLAEIERRVASAHRGNAAATEANAP